MRSVSRLLSIARPASLPLVSRAAAATIGQAHGSLSRTSFNTLVAQPTTQRSYASQPPLANDELELNQRLVQEAYDKYLAKGSTEFQSPENLIRLIQSTRPLPFVFSFELIEKLLFEYANNSSIYEGKTGDERAKVGKEIVKSARKLQECLASLIQEVDLGKAEKRTLNLRVYPEMLMITSKAQAWDQVWKLAQDLKNQSPETDSEVLTQELWATASKYFNSLVVPGREYDPYTAALLLVKLLKNTSGSTRSKLPSLILERFVHRLRGQFNDRVPGTRTSLPQALRVVHEAFLEDRTLRSTVALENLFVMFTRLNYDQAEPAKEMLTDLRSGGGGRRTVKASGEKEEEPKEEEPKGEELKGQEPKKKNKKSRSKKASVKGEVEKGAEKKGRVFEGKLAENRTSEEKPSSA